MDERVAAREQAGDFVAVGHGRQQMHMRIVGGRTDHARAIAPVAGDHQPDGRLGAGGAHGLDDHRPALLRAMPPGAEQQRRFGPQRAAFEQPCAERFIAQVRREDARLHAMGLVTTRFMPPASSRLV